MKILQEKDWHDWFILESDDYRHVRSIRVIDEIWEKFGKMALERCITLTDLFEKIVKLEYGIADSDRIIFILQGVLKLKANPEGAIKN